MVDWLHHVGGRVVLAAVLTVGVVVGVLLFSDAEVVPTVLENIPLEE